METYTAICNISRKKTRHKEMDYEVHAAFRNNPDLIDYPVGYKFTSYWEDETCLCLQDLEANCLVVPLGEKQCFSLDPR